ncbi:hypothetical protein Sjap_021009 [Stephania japonica]|uniref:Serine/threonine-protein phosphatase n=1 Tax=Stephania japonica TaxID=461633 RepID=A0AAP0I0W0_9MAGN
MFISPRDFLSLDFRMAPSLLFLLVFSLLELIRGSFDWFAIFFTPNYLGSVIMLMDQKLLDDIISNLLEFGRYPFRWLVQLSEQEIQQLCATSREIFLSQPNLLELEAPIKICGDIHGHYGDLLRLLFSGGLPPKANYLFLGNYVDHGMLSIETICLLFAYKIKYPDKFFLLRGNHECSSVNCNSGFYNECKTRFNIQLWKVFNDCFNCMPVAAIIDEKTLCLHGGLSPDLQNLDQIKNIRRPTDVPDSGLLCDLLWAGRHIDVKGWGMNRRGVSCTFGADIVEEFVTKHDLDVICRSCQVAKNGYEIFADKRMVTIFSASNFRGMYNNAAGMMTINEDRSWSFLVLYPPQNIRSFSHGSALGSSSSSPPIKDFGAKKLAAAAAHPEKKSEVANPAPARNSVSSSITRDHSKVSLPIGRGREDVQREASPSPIGITTPRTLAHKNVIQGTSRLMSNAAPVTPRAHVKQGISPLKGVSRPVAPRGRLEQGTSPQGHGQTSNTPSSS